MSKQKLEINLDAEVRYSQKAALDEFYNSLNQNKIDELMYSPLMESRILYVDFETTDMIPRVSFNKEVNSSDVERITEEVHNEFLEKLRQFKITQIYMKLIQGDEVLGEFSTLVRLPDDVEIQPEATKATGITKDLLKDYELFEYYFDDMLQIVKACDCICAYNSNFDCNILNKEIYEYRRSGEPDFTHDAYLKSNVIKRPWLDPLVWRRHAKMIYGAKNPYQFNKLSQSAAAYGVSGAAQVAHGIGSLHDAAVDTNLLIGLTKAMSQKGEIAFDFAETFVSQDNIAETYYKYRDKIK